MIDNQYFMFYFAVYHHNYIMLLNKKRLFITLLLLLTTQFLFAASFEKYFSKLIRFEGAGYGISKAVWGNKNFTRNEAYQIHKKHYWDKYHGDLIKNQAVAEVLIDQLINAGEGRDFVNIKAFEAILGVKQDGHSSKADIIAANKFKNPDEIVNPYVNYRVHYYHSRKNSGKYPGWFTRAESFKQEDESGNYIADYIILPNILMPEESLVEVEKDENNTAYLRSMK